MKKNSCVVRCFYSTVPCMLHAHLSQFRYSRNTVPVLVVESLFCFMHRLFSLSHFSHDTAFVHVNYCTDAPK